MKALNKMDSAQATVAFINPLWLLILPQMAGLLCLVRVRRTTLWRCFHSRLRKV